MPGFTGGRVQLVALAQEAGGGVAAILRAPCPPGRPRAGPGLAPDWPRTGPGLALQVGPGLALQVGPGLALQVGRYAHARQFKRMRKALKKPKGHTGRVMRDLRRHVQDIP